MPVKAVILDWAGTVLDHGSRAPMAAFVEAFARLAPDDASAALQNPETFSGAIQRMPRYAVGLFPGSLSSYGALVHRSPRISTTGELRLFLCINEKSRMANPH